MIGCCRVQPQFAFIFHVFGHLGIFLMTGCCLAQPHLAFIFYVYFRRGFSFMIGCCEEQPQLAFYILCVWSSRYFPYDRVLLSTTPARFYISCV